MTWSDSDCDQGVPGPGCEFYERDQAGDETWREEGEAYMGHSGREECEDGCGCETPPEDAQRYPTDLDEKGEA